MGALLAPLDAIVGQHWHKGLGKSALGEKPPQQVGNLEGHEKRVRGGAGPENPCNQQIAQKTQDPGNHGHSADRDERFHEIHGVTGAWNKIDIR